MAVEASSIIWANVEDLRKFKGVLIVHTEGACDEDQQAVWKRAWLDVFIVNFVLDFLEAEGLELFKDLFSANMSLALISQCTGVKVEVE